ncbi:unnamed protein product [Alopecurus aequalis]
MEIGHAAKPVGDDRISKLDDAVLGHVLSFLPSKQAARAAALSSRWRDFIACVHTLSFEEPDCGVPHYDDSSDSDDDGQLHPLSRFVAAITAAIVARHRTPAATPPLRAFRVVLHRCKYGDSVAVDQWVSYALKRAGPELELDLRLRCLPIYCHRGAGSDDDEEDDNDDNPVSSADSIAPPEDDHTNDSEDDFVSSEDESVPSEDEDEDDRLYTVPSGLFSCSALRKLRIGPCRLSPPSAISLPSLAELLLTRVSDGEDEVQRLISACPRLADLTLESCDTVTVLSLLDTRLRMLALRCCHNLSHVKVDVSELDAFEYKGSVPKMPFLTTFGATGWFLAMPSLATCTVEICGGEVSGTEELTRLTMFLHHFASTKHLRLRCKHLCPGIGGDDAVTRIPMFNNLQHLELWGHLPQDGDATDIVGMTSRILGQARNLEVLSFAFETGTWTDIEDDGPLACGRYDCTDRELLEAHRLRYNQYSSLDAPNGGAMISCLANSVREIHLVHYQGGRAQRTLARFLLRNAPVIDELWCQFADGPLWLQTELMREMKTWVMNHKANMVFL